MSHPWWTLALPLALLAASPGRAADLSAIDAFLQKQVADQKIAGGVVLVFHKGETAYLKAFGKRDLEAGRPMETDTIVRLYSMSKAITSAAALTLVDAGKVGLDDPVSKYIPSMANLKVAGPDGVRDPSRPPTVRDLLLHTAGFTYGDGPKASAEAFGKLQPLNAPDLKEMCERLAQVPLAHDPGSDWHYGTNTDVLGRVVEVASGETLDVYLSKTIFEPLGMADTAFSVPADKVGRFAGNYARDNGKLKLVDAPAESKFARPATQFSGGGGLVGTAGDYGRFLLMIHKGGELDGKRVLKAETVKLMTTNQLPTAAYPIHFGPAKRKGVGFGLGFSVRVEDADGNDPGGTVGEYGWGGMASTHYWASPKDDAFVVTIEQIVPYNGDTEVGLKRAIYEALRK